jgi:hypothetical protein
MTQQQADEILHARMNAAGHWLYTGELANVLIAADKTLTYPEAYRLARQFETGTPEAQPDTSRGTSL